MTRVENTRRSFQRFISDEMLDRLVDEILYALDVEGIVASVQEQVHKMAKELFVKCQYLGEEGDRIQQEYLHLLDDGLSLVYPAVRLKLNEKNTAVKRELRNFITYVVRNKRYAYDSSIWNNRLKLSSALFYTMQRAALDVIATDRIYRCVERAFADRELTTPEEEEKKALEELLYGLHRFVVSAVCDGLERKCEKALAIVEQVVISEWDIVIEKLFHVEVTVDYLTEFCEMDNEWISKVFGDGSISYLADAVEELKHIIDTVAPYEE